MLSYHFYPRNYGIVTTRDAQIWIERHQAIATIGGKVAYLGEGGFVAPDAEPFSERNLHESLVRHERTGRNRRSQPVVGDLLIGGDGTRNGDGLGRVAFMQSIRIVRYCRQDCQ